MIIDVFKNSSELELRLTANANFAKEKRRAISRNSDPIWFNDRVRIGCVVEFESIISDIMSLPLHRLALVATVVVCGGLALYV